MTESQNLVNITSIEDKTIIHELIKGKLWRFSYIYIITSNGLDEIKKYTFKQFKIIGINYQIAYLWRKNDFKSRNLVIIPNKDIMDQIPTIHTEIRNRRHYMPEFEWEKIISFKNSFNVSNKVIFSRIIGKRSNFLAILYHNQALFVKSKECLKKSLDIDSQNDGIWVELGDANEKLKNITAAVKCYEQALKINKLNSEAELKLKNLREYYDSG